jgi:hypothetical protein
VQVEVPGDDRLEADQTKGARVDDEAHVAEEGFL